MTTPRAAAPATTRLYPSSRTPNNHSLLAGAGLTINNVAASPMALATSIAAANSVVMPDGRRDHRVDVFRPVDVLGRAADGPNGGPSQGELPGQHRRLVGEQGRRPIAQPPGQRRAVAVGADGDGERTVAGDRGQDERAVGGLIGGVHPDPGRGGIGGDGGVHVGVAGGGDDEAHAVEIARLVGTLVEFGDEIAVEVGPDVRADHPHGSTCRGEAGDLAGGDRSGPDHEDRDPLEGEEHGIAERHGHISHDESFPTKLIDLVRICLNGAVFDDAHPTEVLRWAGEEFGDGLVVTAGFGDAVLVHLVSQAIPDADIVLLDTGYLFAETEWFAEHLRQRYRLNLRTVHPRPEAEPDQWRTDTDACCHARKVEPMERVLAAKTAWVTGLRRSDSPVARQDAGRARRPAPPGDQDQPARPVDRRRRRPVQGDGAAARASLGRPGLPVDRLLAVHPPRGRRRRPAVGSLGGQRQERVRAPRERSRGSRERHRGGAS